jgi:hypothetical protein
VRKTVLAPVAVAAALAVTACGGSTRHAASQLSLGSHRADPSTSVAPTTRLATTTPAVGAPASHLPSSGQPNTPTSTPSKTLVPEEGINTARPVRGVLLNVQAIGPLTTQSFQAPAVWRMAYMLDCSNLEGAGAFRVSLQGATSKLLVNVQASAGTAVVPEHGAGTYHLVIGSACSYLLQILPGTGT